MPRVGPLRTNLCTACRLPNCGAAGRPARPISIMPAQPNPQRAPRRGGRGPRGASAGSAARARLAPRRRRHSRPLPYPLALILTRPDAQPCGRSRHLPCLCGGAPRPLATRNARPRPSKPGRRARAPPRARGPRAYCARAAALQQPNAGGFDWPAGPEPFSTQQARKHTSPLASTAVVIRSVDAFERRAPAARAPAWRASCAAAPTQQGAAAQAPAPAPPPRAAAPHAPRPSAQARPPARGRRGPWLVPLRQRLEPQPPRRGRAPSAARAARRKSRGAPGRLARARAPAKHSHGPPLPAGCKRCDCDSLGPERAGREAGCLFRAAGAAVVGRMSGHGAGQGAPPGRPGFPGGWPQLPAAGPQRRRARIRAGADIRSAARPGALMVPNLDP